MSAMRGERDGESEGNKWVAVSLGNCSKHFECRGGSREEQHNTMAPGSQCWGENRQMGGGGGNKNCS